jgi:transcription initiation factor TFIIIB Brf1 subunit/transcription initiation factor TFIIB
LNNIAQAIMNINYQIWKFAEIIKVTRKLELEGSNLFEIIEWFVDNLNLNQIFLKWLNNIAQAIMNINHQIWRSAEIIKVMRKLELEGSNLFEMIEWFVDNLNLIKIYIFNIWRSNDLNNW